MTKAELQKIRDGLSDLNSDLVSLIADMLEQYELLCNQEPCPKCGYGVTGACYGCEIKRLKEKLADRTEARDLYFEETKQLRAEIERLEKELALVHD